MWEWQEMEDASLLDDSRRVRVNELVRAYISTCLPLLRAHLITIMFGVGQDSYFQMV